eukprot:gene49797-5062_t
MRVHPLAALAASPALWAAAVDGGTTTAEGRAAETAKGMIEASLSRAATGCELTCMKRELNLFVDGITAPAAQGRSRKVLRPAA